MTNLYGYVLNDPVNFVDPWGLEGAGIYQSPIDRRPIFNHWDVCDSSGKCWGFFGDNNVQSNNLSQRPGREQIAPLTDEQVTCVQQQMQTSCQNRPYNHADNDCQYCVSNAVDACGITGTPRPQLDWEPSWIRKGGAIGYDTFSRE